MGEFKAVFQEKIKDLIPDMLKQLQMPAFEVGEIEFKLAAHGNGAFFARHIDTAAHKKSRQPRMISAVYYLHYQPKGFTGGNFRFHPLPIKSGNDSHLDIAPDHNSLLVFPSWASHEVLPVCCADDNMKTWRFAVNCWIHKM
jgi:SM-20-related protein